MKKTLYKSLLYISLLTVFSGCGGDTGVSTLAGEQVTETPKPEEQEKTTEELRREEIEQNLINSKNLSLEEQDLNSSAPVEEKLSDEVRIDPESETIDVDFLNTQLESLYFDFDKFSIRENMLPTLNSNVKLLNSSEAIANEVVVEGNCDEWGTDEYNYALGLKRAQVIKEALIAEGVGESRLRIISYGESNPICLEQKDECWAKNRRADFKILKNRP
jgi:peptidoglycan-associated lipoprotein